MTELGPGKEFDAIREMLARWGDRARGIGDDAAILDVPLPDGERLVVSTDASVEHTHFRRGWLGAREIGYRATVAALSDLAAMGARAIGVLVALGVTPAWRAEMGALADGIGEAAEESGAAIVGGDIVAAADLLLTVTAIGAAACPVERGGARPGDALYVTGRLGGPVSALRALQRAATPAAEHRERFARPRARIREGQWLAGAGARAMIDVSDGLLADAGHLAAASGARLVVELERLPVLAGVDARHAAQSGEEYELLVAAPPGLDADGLERETGTPLTAIGRVEAGPAEAVAMLRGARIVLDPGHDHFAG